jgi:hypothetical protein
MRKDDGGFKIQESRSDRETPYDGISPEVIRNNEQASATIDTQTPEYTETPIVPRASCPCSCMARMAMARLSSFCFLYFNNAGASGDVYENKGWVPGIRFQVSNKRCPGWVSKRRNLARGILAPDF